MSLQRKISTIFFAVFVLILNSSSAFGGDWPGWRGRNYDGVAAERNVIGKNAGLKIAWKNDIGSGYSGIAVANGAVVTMASAGGFDYIVALDTESGAVRWRYEIASTYPGRDGAVDGPVSTPVISGNQVFGLGPKGDLVAVDLKSGKKFWSTNLEADHHGLIPNWGFTTSPLVYEDLLIVQTGGTANNAISAFDTKTGKLAWAAGADTIEYQSPLIAQIDGQAQLVWAGKNSLYGTAPKTGQQLWSYAHGAETFYAKIINPVMVGPDRFLLTYKPGEAALLQLAKSNGDFEVKPMWTSKALKRNYNIPVYHDGNVYGFDGNFLVCVDGGTGEMKWKSRPPGNGFTILADGHVIVVTKRGSLHLIEATPTAYHDVASLQVSDKLIWTPASFADGSIYVRDSFSSIVKIDITQNGMASGAERSQPAFFIANSEFGKFVKRVESASNKKNLIDEFMAAQKRFPIVEGNNLAHIVYRGEAKDMALRGDMLEFFVEQPMNQIAGTDFYYASFEFEPDGRLGYQLIKDFGPATIDSLNQQKAPSLFGGEQSQIVMPRAMEARHLDAPTTARGKIDSLEFTNERRHVGAGLWGGKRDIQVYLPPGYENGAERYPVIYVNYGDDAVASAKMANTLGNLIGKSIRPVIAVFITAISPYECARSQRDAYAEMLAKELIPFIDQKYRTITSPNARALMGYYEGGWSAFYTAFKYPQVFGMAAGQSITPVAEGGDLLLNLVRGSSTQPLLTYLDWGKYDARNATNETDVRGYSTKLNQILKQEGHKVAGGESNTGSDIGSWRIRTDKILETFFAIEEK
jgi:enterochelin esterase-like enzyme/outer membrane protein assembly factor BamB